MKGIYDKLEQKLRDHALLRKEIQNRKLELEFTRQVDDNTTAVQTSKGKSNPTAQLVERWEMDGNLITLKRRYQTIEKFLGELDETDRLILEMRYMSRKVYDWKIIAKRVGYAEGTCRNKRKEALDRLGNYLSWES